MPDRVLFFVLGFLAAMWNNPLDGAGHSSVHADLKCKECSDGREGVCPVEGRGDPGGQAIGRSGG
ncbi:MAG: hypothetical protein ACP5VE_10835 [Chthonomonadales bacterium]